ncbi:hypothetical protein DYQ86_20685 [Acidobacteria bacterium AB60]|nr:hypothetical protein DYQ86_20685 [Acidobacteria bacterium AB60]
MLATRRAAWCVTWLNHVVPSTRRADGTAREAIGSQALLETRSSFPIAQQRLVEVCLIGIRDEFWISPRPSLRWSRPVFA